jgi:hypothetical protein
MLIAARHDYKSTILERFPENSRAIILDYLQRFNFQLKITKPRKFRLGSFKAAPVGRIPVISMNSDLGSYSFLLVFLHELAHLDVWIKYGRKASPHGHEWKTSYQTLVSPLMNQGFLPEKLVIELSRYFMKTPATYHKHTGLIRVLNELEGRKNMLTLIEIPYHSDFLLPDGRLMKKQERLRTRFKCYSYSNRKYYLVPGSAQIIPVKDAL